MEQTSFFNRVQTASLSQFIRPRLIPQCARASRHVIALGVTGQWNFAVHKSTALISCRERSACDDPPGRIIADPAEHAVVAADAAAEAAAVLPRCPWPAMPEWCGSSARDSTLSTTMLRATTHINQVSYDETPSLARCSALLRIKELKSQSKHEKVRKQALQFQIRLALITTYYGMRTFRCASKLRCRMSRKCAWYRCAKIRRN